MENNMADWFKFYNDGLDEPRIQFAISEHPSVVSVWLLILSEASKKRSGKITWRNQDFELFGYARKINVSVPVLNSCIELLTRIEYIKVDGDTIEIPEWERRQSDYSKGIDKGYFKKTSKLLASNSEVSTARREEKREEEKRIEDNNEVEFAEFWALYPNKQGKPKALQSFIKARRKYALDVILSGLRKHIASFDWIKDGGAYIPHPTTWLNQERFNDAPRNINPTSQPPRHTGGNF